MKKEKIIKYKPFEKVKIKNRKWPDNTIDKPPIWCSVDLRDGNQALAVPMNVEEKMKLFTTLVGIGFKQIEVGFPSASQVEFDFIRYLIDTNSIPEDVQIQVLVQAREHLINRTLESLQGIKRAIIHMYNSTSPLQRLVTFNNASKEEIKQIAIKGTKLIKSQEHFLKGTELTYQYSPESFNDTELDFSFQICKEVADIWQPTTKNKIILNLPATVEWSLPNIHADQIEWFCNKLSTNDLLDKSLVSLHTHNDRGTGIAATELGLLAGAHRVEGTLFGNGERTGNVDIVNVALNMNSHGIDTGLDFSNIPHIRNVYENCTKMKVPDRQPYSGDLIFTAFSGSHQDAIKKGMDLQLKNDSKPKWAVPYLTIDPEDIGRSYKAIIRINSQSGKGGVAYILDREFGLKLPKTMHPIVGKFISNIADKTGRELSPDEIHDA